MTDELGDGPEPESPESAAARSEMRPARGRSFLPELTGVEFSMARRGYDRAEVDRYVERVSRIVVELEAVRSPDAVIERALADVGEETSAILRRARKAAEEIIADAESHAGELSARAEAEARALREDADRYSARVRADADRYRDQVSAHIDQLVRERHGLIEDLRKLADQFHRTADRALEQVPGQESSYGSIEGNPGSQPAEAQPA